MNVYFDMDGVLVDFKKQSELFCVRKEDEDIDWVRVFLLGERFWTEMDWLPRAESSFSLMLQFCRNEGVNVGILSSVRIQSGQSGKRLWLKAHTDIQQEDVHIVPRSKYKVWYAEPNALLVDDRAKNVEMFNGCGSHGILFTGWTEDFQGELQETIYRLNQQEKVSTK